MGEEEEEESVKERGIRERTEEWNEARRERRNMERTVTVITRLLRRMFERGEGSDILEPVQVACQKVEVS